jgi:hypothetical protein
LQRHFLTTWMELWGFIKSSALTHTVHMKLSLCMSLSAQTKPRGLHDAHHYGIPKLDHGGLQPHNHTFESHAAVSYEYLFCHPSNDWLWPPARRKAQGLLSGSCTLGTAGHQLRLNNLDTIYSLQRQNGWGTINPIPDMARPLLAREEGHPSERN